MNGGPLTFTGTGGLPSDWNGWVVNLGKVSSSGGDVFLIANLQVQNVGTISSPHGSTELAAGQQVLLQDSAAGRQLFVQRTLYGNTVVNRGTIEAAQIDLQVVDGNVYALAGNHSLLRATGTETRDGHIWLVAGTGRVWMDGKFEASNADGSGGIVDTNAARLRIAGGPTVQASQWNITVPSLTIDGLTAPVFQSNLNRGTSINLQATGSGGASGDIDVASSIHWGGAASLTLGAYHSLTIEAAASLKNCGAGNLTLRGDSQAIDNGGSITNNGSVDWSASHGIVSAFYDMNGTYTPGTMLANTSWTSPAYSGLVTQITGYKLVNSLADLENVNADLAGNYALGKDIDASATSNGSYVQVGGNKGAPFTGQFDGQGHTVDSLTMEGIDVSLGMFGVLGTSAVVRDLNIDGTASNLYTSELTNYEGLLASENDGTILRVHTSGTLMNQSMIADDSTVGGLVGINRGTIEHSSSAATIVGGTAGGLVGENDGLVLRSYATGAVAATDSANQIASPGGLVGTNNGTVDESYATGFVDTGCNHDDCAGTGGLVGTNNGTISRSYATGDVGSECGLYDCGGAGGLVAYNYGTISQSFADGVVRAQSGPAEGDATVAGPYGLAWVNKGTIASDVYWNKDASPVPGVGTGTMVPAANGLTSTQMRTASSFAGYDFGPNGAWAMPANGSHPVLRWQLQSSNGG
jgi:hypothetical protein